MVMSTSTFVICIATNVVVHLSIVHSVEVGDVLLSQLVASVQEMSSRDQEYKNEITALRNQLQRQEERVSAMEETIANQHQLISELTKTETETGGRRQSRFINGEAGPGSVAFYAKLNTPMTHLGVNQAVVFDLVITNIGNSYDSRVGVFSAPVTGVYVFSTTITTHYNISTHYAFFLNGSPITVIFVNGHDSAWDSTSDTVVLQLNKGDDVTVRHTENDREIEGGSHSMFSGFLLATAESVTAIVG